MSDTLRDVTIRVSIKQGTVDLKVPDFAPASASIKTASVGLNEVAKVSGVVKEKAKGAADELDRLKNLDAAKAQAVSVGGALAQTGEGAFKLARGAAFLFTSTDDGFAKMAANIAKVQGGFDLFKGSFEVLKGITEAGNKLKGVVAAATAATAASSANTTATVIGTVTTHANTIATEANIAAVGVQATVTGKATATTLTNIAAKNAETAAIVTQTGVMAGAKIAAVALYTALGPVTVAGLALVAVGAGLYKAWRWFAGPEPTKHLKATNELLTRMAQHKKNITEADIQTQRRQSQVKDSFDAGGRSAALEDAKTDSLREQAKIQGQQFNFEARKASLIKEATRQYELQASAAEELAAYSDTTANGVGLQRDMAQAELEFRTRMGELAKQELDVTKAKGDELTKQKTDTENLLKTTKEKIKAEQDALLSAEAKFGQLTKREQKRVTDIAGRGGPATKSEAELVGKAGFDSSSQGFFAKRGRDAGFDQASKGLGGKTSDDLKKLETERSQIEARLEQVKNTLASNQKRQLDLLSMVVKQLEDGDKIEGRLAELERKLLMREARKAASKQ